MVLGNGFRNLKGKVSERKVALKSRNVSHVGWPFKRCSTDILEEPGYWKNTGIDQHHYAAVPVDLWGNETANRAAKEAHNKEENVFKKKGFRGGKGKCLTTLGSQPKGPSHLHLQPSLGNTD